MIVGTRANKSMANLMETFMTDQRLYRDILDNQFADSIVSYLNQHPEINAISLNVRHQYTSDIDKVFTLLLKRNIKITIANDIDSIKRLLMTNNTLIFEYLLITYPEYINDSNEFTYANHIIFEDLYLLLPTILEQNMQCIDYMLTFKNSLKDRMVKALTYISTLKQNWENKIQKQITSLHGFYWKGDRLDNSLLPKLLWIAKRQKILPRALVEQKIYIYI